MQKIIRNIQSEISGEGIGSLVVVWDMAYYVGTPSNAHPDNPAPGVSEEREVSKIHSVRFAIYDKVDTDLTELVTKDSRLKKRLEDDLIEAVEWDSVYGLEQVVGA